MKTTNNPSSFYLHAKKSLGQNFLTDTSVMQNILQSAKDFIHSKHIKQLEMSSRDSTARSSTRGIQANILEIGPGTGVLTKALLDAKDEHYKVTAVEKDFRAIQGLQETLVKEYPNQFTLIDADILKFSPSKFDLCIGNIPYYITSDILMWLCDHKTQFPGALFMLQDEVADRLCAQTNTKDYSRLTIKMQLNFEMTKLFKVPKECFVPKPKVNSAIVLFISKPFSFSNKEEELSFESFTTLLFSHRRKMLRRIFAENLKKLSAEETKEFWKSLAQMDIKQTDRPESISPQNMVLVFNIYNISPFS